MPAYDNSPEGELNKKEFNKAIGLNKKVFKPKQIKKVNEEELFDPEEIEAIQQNITKQQPKKQKQAMALEEMQTAEAELAQRQFYEWKEKHETPSESDVQVSEKLIRIDARMAERKELMPAKDAAGFERNTAITLEEEYPEIFTDDLVKGNLGPLETACILGHIRIINALKMAGQAKGFSFVSACRFNKAMMDGIINVSRAKNGFSAILVRTDKHVSEGVVQHVQRAFEEEKKKKKWGIF